MAWLPAAIKIVGAVVGVVSAVQSAKQASDANKYQADLADYNAKMSDIQAKEAYAAAGREEDEQRRRARMAVGQQLAASAEAGAGLNSDSLRQSIFDAESDALAIRYEGALRGQGFRGEAGLQRNAAQVSRTRASQQRSAGYLNAASVLLNSGTNYYARKP